MKGARLPLTHSLLSLTLSLFVLGLYGLFLLAGQLALEQAREGLEYRIHLYSPVSPERIQEFLSWLRAQRLVRHAQYVSPEESMEGFRQVAGEEFVRAMEGFNPFPPTFRVTFHGELVSSDSVLLFSQRVLEWEIVKEVDYPRRLLEVLEARAGTLRWLGLLIGGIVVAISFLLIFNTVRLAIFARRLEIRTMELVGATRHFIERPFVLVGIFQGVLGSILAVLLLHVGLLLIDRFILPADFLLGDWRLMVVYGGLTIFGVLMGYAASRLALRRFLNKTLENLI
ncbi:MAG: permease-like cell division protein FtsX [Bacteroidia bacterium]|nr:permease-like cell division protein FtsX [Bacteroidia bacterium]MCX7763863.1 permease-like cell division protein FtsX [Bacteroidia bacterium]MDW8057702.1 permease-like cell division protein FtsX [Bacteroidia bacterium]